MKLISFLRSSLIPAVVILQACSKGGSSGGGGSTTPPPPPPPGSSLTVSLSKNEIYADGWDETRITVKDQNNNDVTSSSSLYLDNALYFSTNFYTTTAGTRKFKAVKGAVSSPEVSLSVLDAGPSPYSQKILVEDYTGTWCVFCPRVSMALEAYVNNSHPNCIVIANHGSTGGGAPGTLYGPDPFTFIHHNTMRSNVYGTLPAVAITGYPNAFIDRTIKWNETLTQLNTQFSNRRPPLGLAFQTAVNGNLIQVTTKVKFDVSTEADLKLVVYLVENGIVYDQANTPSNGNGLPNPIPGFVHNGVMRATATDVYGDLIPKSSQVKGTVYSKDYQFDISTIPNPSPNLPVNISNCRVVAFVVVGNNNLNKSGVLNVQIVAAGQNKDFD